MHIFRASALQPAEVDSADNRIDRENDRQILDVSLAVAEVPTARYAFSATNHGGVSAARGRQRGANARPANRAGIGHASRRADEIIPSLAASDGESGRGLI